MANSDGEGELFAAVDAAIEFFADGTIFFEPACVVDGDFLALFWRFFGAAGFQDFILEAGGQFDRFFDDRFVRFFFGFFDFFVGRWAAICEQGD